MKRIILIITGLCLAGSCLFAQVGIGTNSPDPSAMLDIRSTSKGLLIPTMTTAQMVAISSPADGLIVYNSDTHFMMKYNSASHLWVALTETCVPPSNPTAGSNSPVCVGGTLNLTASGDPGCTYSWTGPSGFTSSLQNPSISSVTLANAGTYSVVATKYGCSTNPQATIVVIGSPPVPGTIIGNPVVCTSATGVVYAVTPVPGATGYAWVVPTGATIASGQNTPGITVNFGATGGNITVATSNTCGTSSPAVLSVTTVAHPVAPVAVAGISEETAITARWHTLPNISYYLLDVSTQSNFSSYVPGYQAYNVGLDTTRRITGLTSNTSYYYRLRSVNLCETSGNSNVITQVTLASGSGTWVSKTDFGGIARQGAIAFYANSKIYIGLGGDRNGIFKKDLWEYDPTGNTWTQKADYGSYGRINAVAFAVSNIGYVGMGEYGNSYCCDFWAFDPTNNTWTAKANFPTIGTPPYYETYRKDMIGFAVGTKGYAGMGYTANGIFEKDLYEYNPASNTWTAKTSCTGAARVAATAFATSTKGYVTCGYDGTQTNLKDLWEFDPTGSGTWTQRTDFPGTARFYAAGFAIGTKGYVSTGYDDVLFYNDIWEYNTATYAWTQRNPFPGSLRYMAVGVSDGTNGYIGTGNNGQGLMLKDFWKFTP